MALTATPHTTPLVCGAYLTDGRSLYRVVAPFHGLGEFQVAELEDCLTLETRLYGPDQLWRMGLRRVATAPSANRQPAAAAAA